MFIIFEYVHIIVIDNLDFSMPVSVCDCNVTHTHILEILERTGVSGI